MQLKPCAAIASSSWRLSILWLLAAAMGCGADDDRLEVYPVSGSVTVKGKPAEGASVMFMPVDESLRGPGMPLPTGVVGADGRFQLRSYEPGDGAPAGEFYVAIVWPEPLPPTNPDSPEAPPARDRLNGRYAVPESSGLKATVQAGPNELPPFDLP